jgi:urea transporter
MFGISPLGWVHTIGSLPAIPLAAYMFIRYGRIVPDSTAGKVYFYSMLIGALSVFLVAKQPASNVVAIVTLTILFIGYGVSKILKNGWAKYIETTCLTITTFLLMLPTISETLRRVPDGHPLVADMKDPLLIGAQLAIFIVLIVGLSVQIWYLRKQNRRLYKL